MPGRHALQQAHRRDARAGLDLQAPLALAVPQGALQAGGAALQFMGGVLAGRPRGHREPHRAARRGARVVRDLGLAPTDANLTPWRSQGCVPGVQSAATRSVTLFVEPIKRGQRGIPLAPGEAPRTGHLALAAALVRAPSPMPGLSPTEPLRVDRGR